MKKVENNIHGRNNGDTSHIHQFVCAPLNRYVYATCNKCLSASKKLS